MHTTYAHRHTRQPYYGLGRGRQRDDDGVVDDDAAWREHHVVIDGALRGVHLEACDVIALIADLVNNKKKTSLSLVMSRFTSIAW